MMTSQTGQKERITCNPLSISYRRIETLTPYPGNARTHSKPQVRKIAESIRLFNFTNPVLIDATGTIIAGHGRVEAAKLLGIEEVHLFDE
jgi:ParB-like chromosome segregation protein Spo0J